MRKYFLYTFLLLIISDCFSQPYYFQKFEVEDGISNNSVINSLQDKKGFLWFGTPDGLNRYDGKHFEVFKNFGKPGDIKSNAIYYLHEDKNGRLWIGTERGLFWFEEKTGHFRPVPFTSGKTIRAIQGDDHGGLWIAESSGVYIYYPANGSIKFFPNEFLKGVTSLAKSEDGIMWLGCNNATLAAYDHGKNLFTLYKTGDRGLSTIEKILPEGTAQILIGTSTSGIKIFDRRTTTFSYPTGNIHSGKLFIHDILKYNPDEYWIASESGLFILNKDTYQYFPVKKSRGDPYSISDNAIYSLCKDKEGGVWIGTYFGGINYYSNPSVLFEKYFPVTGQNSINGNVVRRMTEDRLGNLWIGTEDAGLEKLNLATGKFADISNIKKIIPSTNIHGLLADEDELYVGTFEHGLFIINYNNGKIFSHFGAGGGSVLRSNYINTILKRSANEILIGSARGLYSFNKQNKKLSVVNGLPLNAFYSAITTGPGKTVWLGTHSEGVFLMDSNNVVKKLLVESNTTKNVLSETRILNLFFDSKHHLWISTENGLYNVNTLSGKTSHYSYNNGLPSNIVYAVVEDIQKAYWITTSKGLVRLDNNTGKMKTFRKSDGLLTEQFNHHSSFIDESGNIFLGSVKGMIKFNPVNYRESKFIAPIYANHIQLFSQEPQARRHEIINQTSLIENSSIRLPYNYSSFNIGFSILSYKSPDNINFAYKLEPVDQNWNNPGSGNIVSFSNLSPGEYFLKVKSTNSSGLWLPNERTILISITPPFWKSRPAYVLYGLTLILAFFMASLLIIRRNKAKQKRNMESFTLKKEKELYEAKIDFYTNVAHEIKTPLSLIKAPLEKIRLNTQPTPLVSKYMEIVNKNTDRLLELSTQLLDLRKFESDHYHLNFVKLNIVLLVKDLYESFQNLADDKGINYELNAAADSLIVNADEDAIKKIVSNLLDNAIKYSHNSVRVEILKTAGGFVEIIFKNDGEVLPKEDAEKIFEPFYRSKVNNKIKGTGVGLSLAKSLANLNHGNIEYVMEERQNIFIFSMPEHEND